MEKQCKLISIEPGVIRNFDSKFDDIPIMKKAQGKSTIPYNKLVVPQTMRSIYWKYYGFPAYEDGQIITKVKIVCLICNTQIAYNRNTSNLRMHLQNKHAEQLQQLEAEGPIRRPVLSQEAREKRAQKKLLKAEASGGQQLYAGRLQIDTDNIQLIDGSNLNLEEVDSEENMSQRGYILKASNAPVTYHLIDQSNQSNNMDAKLPADIIADFVILDLLPPSIVEGKGFQNLLEALDVQVPSKATLESETIHNLYESYRDTVASDLEQLNGDMGLAIEEWKSQDDQTYLTFSVNYQNSQELILENKVLSTVHVANEWTMHQYTIMLESVMQQWNLNVNKISTVITSSASESNLVKALQGQGLTVVPCLLNTLQKCADECFDIPEIQAVITKCREIIGGIKASVISSPEFAMHEQIIDADDCPFVLDYPPIWTSTYGMMEAVLRRKDAIEVMINSDDLGEFDKYQFELTADQWAILRDVVNTLDPLKVTIVTLCEEKSPPLVSLLKPLLWNLASSHFRVDDSDSPVTQELKEKLAQMLEKEYENIDVFLQTATMLDPRFLQFSTTEEEKADVTNKLQEMLTALVGEEKPAKEIINSREPPHKRSRKSGISFLLGTINSPKHAMPSQDKANLELTNYQSEAVPSLNSCPLEWWSKSAVKCPNLATLAKKYLSIPACCTPSRVASEVQVAFHMKRANIPEGMIDKLLFLHGNHKI